jgi:hypothetical protein
MTLRNLQVTSGTNLARIEEHFHRIASMDPGAQADALSDLSSSDPDLASQVRALIDADATRIDDLFARLGASSDDRLPVGVPTIPDHRLLAEIGRGGFGTVYLAEPLRPPHRCVAIKILRSDVVSHSTLGRFREEAAALARMNHPGILGLIGTGETADGRPYLIMPLVAGEPVTSFCRDQSSRGADDARPAPEARDVSLLFREVALALHHAHTHGILHRDLKPSNIIVSRIDGRPLPQIIDFGLALAIDTSQSRAAALTADGERVGTLRYLSPEQASGHRGMIASDIFSLGLVLYESLFGHPAVSEDRLNLAMASEAGVAALYHDPFIVPDRSCGSRVPRELRWVISKCLELEPAKRYASAELLAADLHAVATGGQLRAGPPARAFRAWRWARRHRTVVVAGLAVAVLAAGVLVASVVVARQGQQGRQNADQLSRTLESMLQPLDPAIAQGRDRTLLIQGLRPIEQSIGEVRDPETRQRLLSMIARSYVTLGEFTAANPLARQSRELAHGLYSIDDPRSVLADVLYIQAVYPTLAAVEDWPEDPNLPRDTVRRIQKIFPITDPRRTQAILDLGRPAFQFTLLPRTDEGRQQYYKDALKGLGPRHRLTIQSLRALGANTNGNTAHLGLARVMEARRRAIETFGEDDPDAVAGLSIEMYLLSQTGGDSMGYAMANIDQAERVLGRLHRACVFVRYNIAQSLIEGARFIEGEAALRVAEDRVAEGLGRDSLLYFYTMADRYRLALMQDDANAATGAFQALTDAARRMGGPFAEAPLLNLHINVLPDFAELMACRERWDELNQVLSLLDFINDYELAFRIRMRLHQAGFHVPLLPRGGPAIPRRPETR